MLYRLTTRDGTKSVEEIELSQLASAGWTEKDFENILSTRIDLVVRESQLMVIAQERHWQEEADILALDEHGTLYIFELKRDAGSQSTLLQVIRYGQIFGRYDYEGLEYLFHKYRNIAASLQEEHRLYFDLNEPLPRPQFNQKQRFIVVTAGTDRDALDAVEYWNKKGLPISALTYHVYRVAGENLIEFHSYGPGLTEYRGLISGCFVVNTCCTYFPNAYLDMLRIGKAAAYGDRASAVDKIKPGDRVYLYHNGAGIIAAGKAKDKARTGNYRTEGNDVTVEHYVVLDLVYAVAEKSIWAQAVRASEINRTLGTSRRFRNTVFSISKAEAGKIDALIAERLPKAKGPSK